MAVTPGHTRLNGFAEVWSLLAPIKLLLSITGELLALRTDHGGGSSRNTGLTHNEGILFTALENSPNPFEQL